MSIPRRNYFWVHKKGCSKDGCCSDRNYPLSGQVTQIYFFILLNHKITSNVTDCGWFRKWYTLVYCLLDISLHIPFVKQFQGNSKQIVEYLCVHIDQLNWNDYHLSTFIWQVNSMCTLLNYSGYARGSISEVFLLQVSFTKHLHQQTVFDFTWMCCW